MTHAVPAQRPIEIPQTWGVLPDTTWLSGELEPADKVTGRRDAIVKLLERAGHQEVTSELLGVVARANGLLGFRKVEPGQTLKFPSADAWADSATRRTLSAGLGKVDREVVKLEQEWSTLAPEARKQRVDKVAKLSHTETLRPAYSDTVAKAAHDTMTADAGNFVAAEANPTIDNMYAQQLSGLLAPGTDDASLRTGLASQWQRAMAAPTKEKRSVHARAVLSAVFAQAKANPRAVEIMMEIAKQDTFIIVGYGSIMYQPSVPNQTLLRFFGKAPIQRNANLDASPRGGPVLSSTVPGTIEQNADGEWVATNIDPDAPYTPVSIDFILRHDADGKDDTTKLLAEYDKRELSGESRPAIQRLYRRTHIPIRVGDAQLSGMAYIGNPDLEGYEIAKGKFVGPLEANRPLSEVSAKIVEGTVHSDSERRPHTQFGKSILWKPSTDALPTDDELEQLADAIDQANAAGHAFERQDLNRVASDVASLERLQAWFDNTHIDAYEPVRYETPEGKVKTVYAKGVHYWEATAWAISQGPSKLGLGADTFITNMMLSLRVQQTLQVVRLRAAA